MKQAFASSMEVREHGKPEAVWLRLLGIGLVVFGLLLLGPISTRGPIFGPHLRARHGEQEPWTYRVWFVRVLGALCVIGGIIYMVHPPHR